ncbi:MAG: BON domain-containing protein [Deltaproteobacteria bacterium]|nr:BON domain-containing protein [Deltaproteobacteria bacterium]
MKKIIKVIPFFIIPLLSSGCGTIYTTAVDQIYAAAVDRRDVNTILYDTTIKLTIVNKFYDDDCINSLNSLDLSVGCYRGHVYLVGEYDKPVQKTRAIKIAKSIEKVKSITTYLLPKKKSDLCGTDENLVIVGKVKAKLIGDKGIWSTNIDVKSVQCNVVLYGLVASKNKIKKAIEHAKSVEGVLSVKSFLKSAG